LLKTIKRNKTQNPVKKYYTKTPIERRPCRVSKVPKRRQSQRSMGWI